MTFKNGLAIGGVIGLALGALGVGILDGPGLFHHHDDPIIIDNPNVTVNFSGHSSCVTSDCRGDDNKALTTYSSKLERLVMWRDQRGRLSDETDLADVEVVVVNRAGSEIDRLHFRTSPEGNPSRIKVTRKSGGKFTRLADGRYGLEGLSQSYILSATAKKRKYCSETTEPSDRDCAFVPNDSVKRQVTILRR